MASNTSFGPQGANATNSIPATNGVNRYGTGVDTWVQDASSSSAQDGTVLNADFFNMIIGNLRTIVRQAIADGATFSETDGDFTLLLEAVKFYTGAAESAFPTDAAGQLTNDGTGALSYVQHLPLTGGVMSGPIDMVTSAFQLGRGYTPATLPTAALYTGAMLYCTGMTATTGYIDGPVFSNGFNWRKLTNEIVA